MPYLEESSVQVQGKRRRYMSGMANMQSSERVEQTAAEWLARRDGGEWKPSDEVALSSWLSASTAHQVAYTRLVAAWERFCACAAAVYPQPPSDHPNSFWR